jgi:hypothetical protein
MRKTPIPEAYTLEIFDQNVWIILSIHKNEDHAKINADVTSKSRKVDARVIHKGSIIYLVKGKV